MLLLALCALLLPFVAAYSCALKSMQHLCAARVAFIFCGTHTHTHKQTTTNVDKQKWNLLRI